MADKKVVIGTLGSHTALQILKGAKDEGFSTLLVTIPKHKAFYETFPFIDEIVTIPSFSEFPSIEAELIKKNVILVPHGSYVAYLGFEKNANMKVAYFGNRQVLAWEENRNKQGEWLTTAGILMPQQFLIDDPGIVFPVIVKSFGAAGGRGYFIAKDKADLEKKLRSFGDKRYVIQQYIIGVPLYVHYFYSPLTDKLEIMSMDRRYETTVDAIGRIPQQMQKDLDLNPSFVVVGNSELVLREGMLSRAYEMGRKVIETSRKLVSERGIFGPFCLETIITPDQKFYVIEISCRIVAGTNLFINGSAYSWLYYDEPMSTGRRIAREIRRAIGEKKLEMLLD
jgi:5-formaminoimidazole-4-carboxamide-1-(beta)-D-ribofuranosyl 5'-monophosphate synthetase